MIIIISSSLLFTKDSNDLVVLPIESMIAKIRRIQENPLNASRIEEEMEFIKENVKLHNEKLNKEDQKKQ